MLGPKLSALTVSHSLRAYFFLGKSRVHADVQKFVEQMSFQVSLRNIKEQFNGIIIAGHDRTVRILNAPRRFLLLRLPVRTLDVS